MVSARKLIGAGLIGAVLVGSTGAALAADRQEAARAAAGATSYLGEGYSQYYGGRRYYGRRRGGGGGAVAAGVIGGLAVGALAGAALAGPGYGYGYGPGGYGPGAPVGYAPGYGPRPVGNVYGRDPNWVNYCASRYRSFDPVSGTYLANDGYRYPCQ